MKANTKISNNGMIARTSLPYNDTLYLKLNFLLLSLTFLSPLATAFDPDNPTIVK